VRFSSRASQQTGSTSAVNTSRKPIRTSEATGDEVMDRTLVSKATPSPSVEMNETVACHQKKRPSYLHTHQLMNEVALGTENQSTSHTTHTHQSGIIIKEHTNRSRVLVAATSISTRDDSITTPLQTHSRSERRRARRMQLAENEAAKLRAEGGRRARPPPRRRRGAGTGTLAAGACRR
jgi:hypothetical protein